MSAQVYDFWLNTYFPDVVYGHFFICFQCHFKTSYSSFGVEVTVKSLIIPEYICSFTKQQKKL